jgi:hypothetical protein
VTCPSPVVLALLDSFVKGWPEHDDERAGVFPLSEVLQGKYDSDVHFTAYECSVERRHTTGSLARADEAGVQMVAAVFDVDGKNHQATDEWWTGELEKLRDLLEWGAFVYRTRNGYRIVFALPVPFPISCAADAAVWTHAYLAWCNYLEHEHGIVADRRCKEWQRLYRAPHATRDGVLLDLETYGDPNLLGVWDIDVEARAEDAISPSPEKNPKNSESLDSPAIAPSPSKRRDVAAKMLGAAWPESGRHGAQLALAGALCHDGWPADAAVDFLCAVCREAGNEERPKREKTVRDTYKAHAEGRPIQGWTALKGYVDGVVLGSARDLLNPHADDFADLSALLGKKAAENAAPATSAAPPSHTKRNSGIFWDDWDEPLPPVKWLVEGLIPQGTVGAFVAHGSSLKTWTMLSIASAVAKGNAWLGKYPVAKGKVVILDYESGRYELRRRVLMLEKGKVVGLGAWSYPEKRIDDVSFWVDLGNEEDVVLVCVDSLAEGSSPGVDENSKDAAYPLQLAAKFTEATGASVLFVHHSKKDDSGDARKVVRGSTAIYAALDWCFAFENVSDTQGCRRMLMNSIKPCMGAKPAPVPLELTDKGLTTFEVGEKPTKASPPAQIQAAIRLALSAGPVENKAKLATAVGLRREAVTPELDAMVVRGEVVLLRRKGYALDSEEHRRKRVIDAVNRNPYRTSKGDIAEAADVDMQTVKECLDSGIIVKSAEGRYVVRQND